MRNSLSGREARGGRALCATQELLVLIPTYPCVSVTLINTWEEHHQSQGLAVSTVTCQIPAPLMCLYMGYIRNGKHKCRYRI